ncbi:AAA family ATPase [Actinoplanes sp. NPDC048791]|uniref:AAA family ATPase n=1 Tax=Actinoplanes sp. NPDC048791 TaxID=3154623 RepID=UPI0033EE53D3
MVEVRGADSGRGSGYAVSADLVLTAAHVIGGDSARVMVGDEEVLGTVVWRNTGLDAALIRLPGPRWEPRAVRWAVLSGVRRVQFTAVGFPKVQKTGDGRTVEEAVAGFIMPLTGLRTRRYGLNVETALPAGTTRQWSLWGGLSGAAVLDENHEYVLGIVIEVPIAFQPSRLEAQPVAALFDDPEFTRLVGVDSSALVGFPPPPPPPPSEWESARERLTGRGIGMTFWTDEEIAAGWAESGQDDPPLEEGQPVDVISLRRGEVHNLQRAFGALGRAFDTWLRAEPRKRVRDPLRIFWITGEPGTFRDRALLAILARAGTTAEVIGDAGLDPSLATTAIVEFAAPVLPKARRVVGVNLSRSATTKDWADLDTRLRQTAGRGGTRPLLIVAGSAEQEQAVYDELRHSAELDPYDVKGNPAPSPASDAGATGMNSQSLGADDIFYRGLPSTAQELLGRERELAEIRAAWASGQTRILTIVAPGGVGKSSLVNQWLREMRDQDYHYPAVRKVLAWSFYSQGTRNNLASAETFMIAALEWFGDPEAARQNGPDRALALAEHVRDQPTLLILDGVEPLQHPLAAGEVGGRFTDTSMTAFLDALAEPGPPGFCLITTRVPVADLEGDAVHEMLLDNLDDRAGAELLRNILGRSAKPDERELRAAVREVDGHALALNLLGRYVRDAHAGRLSGRRELESLAVAVDDGGHARRIMETSAGWLEQHRRLGELTLLNIIGLFDRPAPPEAMAAVLGAGTDRLADGLDRVGGDEWNRAVAALRRMGLLNTETPGQPGVLDAHPLVREHFRDRLKTHDLASWKAGNGALFEHYRGSAPPLPDRAADMNLLYAAVNHGCAIDRHQQVFDEVLVPRVWRGTQSSFSTRRLGMAGSEIVALSNYVRLPNWNELRDLSLTFEAELTVLSNASLRLRQLGRLHDARASCGAVLDALDERPDAEPGHVEQGAYTACLDTELLVVAGALDQPLAGEEASARQTALRAIDFADRGNDAYFRMYARSCDAEVSFMLGDLDGAGARFAEAMAVPGSRLPFLYSQNTYRYGYYLIETGRAAEILAGAEDPGWALNGDDSSQLSLALRKLIVGAAVRSVAEQGKAAPNMLANAWKQLDSAVVALRSVGYTDYLIRGLLERVRARSVGAPTENYAGALRDLERGEVEAERGGMRLFTADIHLLRAELHLAYWPAMTGRERDNVAPRIQDDVRAAGDLVRALNYGRRSRVLAALEERVQTTTRR